MLTDISYVRNLLFMRHFMRLATIAYNNKSNVYILKYFAKQVH